MQNGPGAAYAGAVGRAVGVALFVRLVSILTLPVGKVQLFVWLEPRQQFAKQHCDTAAQHQ